jgi:3-deoxy-manno-octulosonate cytidylyltransferase (CMP-KDO synthetase)
MQIIGIIPARYASTRFPGKPLADIQGKPMIQRVYEQSKKSNFLSEVYVATDDERIVEVVSRFAGNVLMTASTHPSGTDRCNEVAEKLVSSGKQIDVVVNIQGDEPYIQPEQIDLVCSCFVNPDIGIATLVKKIETHQELFENAINKVVVDKFNNAIYFSRTPIPFLRNKNKEEWHYSHTYFKHIGLYAYRTNILREITHLSPSLLEQAESLEQLRWIENGYKIHIEKTQIESFSVDTPEDISKFTNKS